LPSDAVGTPAPGEFVYAIIDRFTVQPNWTGAPLVLQVNENAKMPQTPDGTMIFAYTNMSDGNNAGQIAITTGGGPPTFYDVPALQNAPSLIVYNWKGNTLSVTNISLNANTPIQIQAFGPGIPGTTPQPLDIGPPGVSLGFEETAQAGASTPYSQLVLQNELESVIAFIGGPADASGNNGYVIGLNYPENSGPPPLTPPPAGFYATTVNNMYTYTFTAGSGGTYVANMSSDGAGSVSVVLRQL
jgi:hypothetical protein